MAFVHEPVLVETVIRLLVPRPGGRYVDATVGGGGHAEAILQASAPSGSLLGLDVDPDAIEAAQHRLKPFTERTRLLRGSYGRLSEILRRERFSEEAGSAWQVDGIVVDLGVSSHQLDTPRRGFSFQREGPLDMRMSKDGQTCAELIDSLQEDGLATILRRFGEVRKARRLASEIKAARLRGQLNTTVQLARLVEELVGRRSGRGIHPATQVFQALRIAVNRELDELGLLCESVPDLLAPSGVAVVIAFHSLEDRIVKRSFSKHAHGPVVPEGVPLRGDEMPGGTVELLTRTPIRPRAEEIAHNPRARSARLRAIRKKAESMRAG